MDNITRRSVLASLGITGTIGLAGCGGSNRSTGTATSAETPTIEPTTTLAPTSQSRTDGPKTLTETSSPVTRTEPSDGTPTNTAPKSTASMPAGVSKVLAEDGRRWDGLGSSVAACGDTILVLAPGVDIDGGPSRGGAGAVYVFEREAGGWHQRTKLDPSVTPYEGDYFGSDVALDDGTAVIGGMTNDPSHDSRASVFERQGENWDRQTTFPLEGESTPVFGEALELDGDTALVSGRWVHRTQKLDDEDGGAYVFEREDGEWRRQSILSPEDDVFAAVGREIAVDDDMAFVSNVQGNRHSVAVFERTGSDWHQTVTLTKSDDESGTADDSSTFAASITVQEGTALVGDSWYDDQGAVYAFERSNGDWERTQRLMASDGDSEDVFGLETALEDDLALVAAPYDDDPYGRSGGSAYLFERSDGQWQEQAKLVAPDGDAVDLFASSVELTNRRAVIGAKSDGNVRGLVAGAVYVFDLSTILGD